jgi:hypothetical protein
MNDAYRQCYALWEWAAFHKVVHEEIDEFLDVTERLERLLDELRPPDYTEDWLNDAMRATLARAQAENPGVFAELSHGRELLWIRRPDGRVLGTINRAGDYTAWPNGSRMALPPPPGRLPSHGSRR